MTLSVSPIHPASASWDGRIAASSSATLFHSGTWLSADTAMTFVVESRGAALGGLVLPLRTTARSERPHVIPYSGFVPFQPSTAISRRSAELLAEWVRDHHPTQHFCTSPWADSLEPWVCTGFRATLLYTSIVDLQDLDVTYGRFSTTLRANLRAARRSALAVVSSVADESLERALALSRATFVRQGSSPWYDEDELATRLRSACRRSSARVFETVHEGATRAAVVVTWDQWRGYYLLGGLNREVPHRGALSLSLWAAARWLREERGLTALDLEGSNQPAIASFFEHFGGRWTPFHRVSYVGGNIFND